MYYGRRFTYRYPHRQCYRLFVYYLIYHLTKFINFFVRSLRSYSLNVVVAIAVSSPSSLCRRRVLVGVRAQVKLFGQ